MLDARPAPSGVRRPNVRRRVTLAAVVFVVGTCIWLLAQKLLPSPLMRTAITLTEGMAQLDGARIYDGMSGEERAALGVTRAQFAAAWDEVIRPDFAQMKLVQVEPPHTNGEVPHQSVASVIFQYPDGTPAGLSSIAYPTERGVVTNVSYSLFRQWAMNRCRLETGSTEQTNATLRRLVAEHRSQLESHGLKGYYSLGAQRLITWDELLAKR